MSTGPGQHFVFSIKFHPEVTRGSIGFSLPQRKWATLSLGQDIDVKPYHFNPTSSSECLCTIVLEADFLQKKSWVSMYISGWCKFYNRVQFRSSLCCYKRCTTPHTIGLPRKAKSLLLQPYIAIFIPLAAEFFFEIFSQPAKLQKKNMGVL